MKRHRRPHSLDCSLLAGLGAVLLLVLAASAPVVRAADDQDKAPSSAATEASPSIAEDSRCFEMRTYHTHPGKLEALHKRFREHTNKLFEKHGMTLIGYWVPDDRENTLVYILAYPSREARDKAWDGFRNDPEWKKAFAESRVDGPIVEKVESVFLEATDYSPIK